MVRRRRSERLLIWCDLSVGGFGISQRGSGRGEITPGRVDLQDLGLGPLEIALEAHFATEPGALVAAEGLAEDAAGRVHGERPGTDATPDGARQVGVVGEDRARQP